MPDREERHDKRKESKKKATGLSPEQVRRAIALMKELAGIWVTARIFFGSQLRIITLNEGSGPDTTPRASKLRKDSVCWKNDDVVARTISFSPQQVCPLQNFPPGGVTLNPGENSVAFVIREDVPTDRFQYTIQPSYPISSGPGEPIIFADD
jgi:hypothetical protein